jgi:hypothetical protein
MTFVLRLRALALFLSMPAGAQEMEIQIGSGPICDTQKQTERLVALLDGGAESAIKLVNAEENDPTACVVATVAYVRGPQASIAHSKAGTYRIVKVLVLGLHTPNGILATAPAAYFTILKVEEQEA